MRWDRIGCLRMRHICDGLPPIRQHIPRICTGHTLPLGPLASACLLEANLAIKLTRDSSPGENMRQQTKPFTVEIKQSRKPKSGNEKPSIWGKLDLSIAEDANVSAIQPMASAPSDRGDRL